MKELLSKAILTGLGFMNLTREAMQETVTDLVNESKLSEEEGRKVVKAFARRSARMEQMLEKRVNSAVHMVLQNLDLTTMQSRMMGKKKKSRPKKKAAASRRSGKSSATGAKRRKR